ncbi:MAG: TIGR02266 family protein [Deltaproteobacteria bacterium]|nr:TIGR02266 family protein [Deltaproteobacteria bacterium]
MADGSDKREAERVASALRLKLKYADVETFVDKFATNISKGGIFIATRQPKPAGTSLRFELLLENGQKLIRGEGVVSWVKDFDPKQPARPHGMGVKFTKLDADSRVLVDRMLAVKQKRASSGAASPSDGVPVSVASSESGAVKGSAPVTPSAPVNVLAIDSAPVPRETAKINGHAEGRKPGPPPPPPMALRGPGKAPPPVPAPPPREAQPSVAGATGDDDVEIDIEAAEPPTAVMPTPLPPLPPPAPEEATQMVPMAAFLGEPATSKAPSPDEATQMVSMRSFLAEPPAAAQPAPPPDEATQMTSMASFLAELPPSGAPTPPRPVPPAPPVLAPRAPAQPLAPPPALENASASARVAELLAWGERELSPLGGDDLDAGTIGVIAARARALAADVGDVSALGQPAPAAVPPSLDEAARGLGRLAKS